MIIDRSTGKAVKRGKLPPPSTIRGMDMNVGFQVGNRIVFPRGVVGRTEQERLRRFPPEYRGVAGREQDRLMRFPPEYTQAQQGEGMFDPREGVEAPRLKRFPPEYTESTQGAYTYEPYAPVNPQMPVGAYPYEPYAPVNPQMPVGQEFYLDTGEGMMTEEEAKRYFGVGITNVDPYRDATYFRGAYGKGETKRLNYMRPDFIPTDQMDIIDTNPEAETLSRRFPRTLYDGIDDVIAEGRCGI